jgi:LysM repeat protein
MTICRSSVSALLGLALAAALPAAAAAQVSDKPASHTVKSGDTLWGLASRFLGDPFLWPQIYRLNTDLVEDPHWIYPGEVLRLVGGEGVRAVPSAEPAEPAEAAEPAPAQAPVASPQEPTEAEYPMPEFARRAATKPSESLRAYANQKYQPLRAGEFFSAPFLTEEKTLPSGMMLGPLQPPDIRYIREGQPAQLFTRVGLLPPEGGSYSAGDTLIAFQRQLGMQGYGDIVVPTGLVRVVGRDANQYLAEVIDIFGPVRYGQEVMPAEKFSPGPEARAVATTDTLTGAVLGGREKRELKVIQARLLISVGREDGVAPGDIFEIWRAPRSRAAAAYSSDELMARGQVVHVGDRSATLVLTMVVAADIPPGTPARRVAKLPS